MSSFTDDNFDWRRIDVQALVTDHGFAVVEENHRESCSRWLRAHDYQIISLDCTAGNVGADGEDSSVARGVWLSPRGWYSQPGCVT
jgi:hypothetical protein